MKKKFRLWLNIVTICLCLCAIAIGVYAATTATLTVSGQIGFSAHGVDVSVKGYIYGHAAGNTDAEKKNGLPVVYDENNKVWLTYTQGEEQVSTGTTALQVTDSTKTLNIGDRYFSDINNDPNGKPTDIVIVLNFTNASKFSVLAKVESTTSENSNVNIETTQSVVMDKQGGTTTTGSITFTLSLKANAQGEYEGADLAAVSFGIKFEKTTLTSADTKQNLTYNIKKFTTEEQEAIKTSLGPAVMGPGEANYRYYSDTILTYAQLYPYYLEMGINPITKDPARWLIVGYEGKTEGENPQEELKVLTTQDYDALSQGVMLNKNYYLLSEKILITDVEPEVSIDGMPFQNDYTSSGDYSNPYGIKANDYASSNVRNFLKGKDGVCNSFNQTGSYPVFTYTPNGSSDKFVETYKLLDSPLYEKIQKRSLSNLYEDIKAETIEATGINKVTGVPESSTEKDIDASADTFWLLSKTEVIRIFTPGGIESTDYVSAGYMAARVLYYDHPMRAVGRMWWLRSPGISDGGKLDIISDYGGISSTSAGANIGVRPAFKI